MKSAGVSVHARLWTGARPELPPLILVAGLGVSSRYWVRLGRRLAGQRTILAPDLPGFGLTPAPPSLRWPAASTIAQQAQQLHDWMIALGISRAVLCGHSLGCQIATEFARRWPDEVDKLILAAPTFDPRSRTLWQSIPRLLLGSCVEVPSLPPLLVLEYASAGLFRAVVQAKHAMRDRIELKLPKVTVPALVIHGRYDPLVSEAWARQVAALLPVSQLVQVDGVGHAMQWSAATVTTRVIEQFLAGDELRNVEVDDPCQDPAGPWQPVPAGVHVATDVALSALALAIAWHKTATADRIVKVAASINLVNALVAGPPRMPRRLPMIAHASNDMLLGLSLIGAAASLRRERPAARLALTGVGLLCLAGAILTAKPTGPATPLRSRASGKD